MLNVNIYIYYLLRKVFYMFYTCNMPLESKRTSLRSICTWFVEHLQSIICTRQQNNHMSHSAWCRFPNSAFHFLLPLSCCAVISSSHLAAGSLVIGQRIRIRRTPSHINHRIVRRYCSSQFSRIYNYPICHIQYCFVSNIIKIVVTRSDV